MGCPFGDILHVLLPEGTRGPSAVHRKGLWFLVAELVDKKQIASVLERSRFRYPYASDSPLNSKSAKSPSTSAAWLGPHAPPRGWDLQEHPAFGEASCVNLGFRVDGRHRNVEFRAWGCLLREILLARTSPETLH